MWHARSQGLRLIRNFVHLDPCVSASPETSDMSTEEASPGAVDEAPQAASVASPAAAPASRQSRKALRPKIDLDDEIRRANDLAAMSRKMLLAAKNVSRNNKKAKQRLIKKAGKLSPEDLERIAVLKRCGMYDEDGEEKTNKAQEDKDGKPGTKKSGPSAAEIKRPKLSTSMETLTAANPILQEIGIADFGVSSGSAGSSSSRFSAKAAVKKQGPVILHPRARLTRAPTGLQSTEDSQVHEDEQ